MEGFFSSLLCILFLSVYSPCNEGCFFFSSFLYILILSILEPSHRCHLIPLYYFLLCSSAYSQYSFCLVFFSAYWLVLLTFFFFLQKILQIFSLRHKHQYDSIWQLGDDGWWYVQHAAMWHWCLPLCVYIIFYCFCPFFLKFFNLVFINQTKFSRYQHVLALFAF